MTTKKSLLLAFVVTSALATMASAQRPIVASDAAFVQKAAAGQQAEINLGNLAVNRGRSSFTKDFGRMMVHDHGAALSDLKSLARDKRMSISTDPTREQKATYNRLARLSGSAFDREFRREMMKGHKMHLNAFKKESQSAIDRDVRAFAKKCVPVISMHLRSLETKTIHMH